MGFRGGVGVGVGGGGGDQFYIGMFSLSYIIEPAHDQTNNMAYALSEDSDQPGHTPSLISVFVFRMKKPWVLSDPLSAQRRLWSDWADVQADLNLRWAHDILLVLLCAGSFISVSSGYLFFQLNNLLAWFVDTWAAPSETVPSDICAQKRFRSACAFAQSDRNLFWAHLDSQWCSFFMQTSKTRTRLRECAGWI